MVEFVTPFNWNESFQSLAWISYIVIFYLTFGVLLLNIFLAIIVDTFGQLREARIQSQAVKGNSCFICSIERDTFKRQGIEFSTHIEKDHNIWNYLYFFAYLKDQSHKRSPDKISELDLQPVEREMKRLIGRRRYLRFFPIERAGSLESGEEGINHRMFNKLIELEKLTVQGAEVQTKLLNENKDLRATVSNLADEVIGLRRAQERRNPTLTHADTQKQVRPGTMRRKTKDLDYTKV